MRVFFPMIVSAVLLSAAGPQAPQKNKTRTAAAPAAAKAAKPLEIPADAVESETGVFKYTDPQGKKWIYRKTPFGVARLEDKPPAEAGAPVGSVTNLKAIEDGDTVRFERPTPFGVHKWQKKKSELDEMERAAWTRAQMQTNPQANPVANPRTRNDAPAKQD